VAKKPRETLRVLPNPYLFGGEPLCACASDPVEHVEGRYIGARPIVTSPGETITVGTLTGTIGGERHEVEWEFSTEVQEIPDTLYYRQMLRERALVPADAATAAKAGIKGFTSAEALLAKCPDTETGVVTMPVEAKE
jgi:hypothetical protein